MMENSIYPIPGFQEPFSSLTHLVGAGVYLILSFILLRKSWGNFSRFVAFAIFSFSCVFMLSMSGVYHMISDNGTAGIVLQRLDHASIFVFIVGTMTPIHRMLFTGFMRWGWLTIVWSIAITALTLKTIFFTSVSEWLGLLFYLVLGWLGVITILFIWRSHGIKYVKPMIWGGLAYSIGAISEFFYLPILIEGVIGPHEIFHIAVLIGISFHWKFVFGLTNIEIVESTRKDHYHQ